MKKQKKLLFILKKHLSSGGYGDVPKAGLYNSAKMTSDELRNNFNVVTNLEISVDANCKGLGAFYILDFWLSL